VTGGRGRGEGKDGDQVGDRAGSGGRCGVELKGEEGRMEVDWVRGGQKEVKDQRIVERWRCTRDTLGRVRSRERYR